MVSLIRIAVILLNAAWLGWAWWRAGNTRHPFIWRLLATVWFVFIMGFYFWLSYARFNTTDVPIPGMPLGIVYIWALLVLAPLAACIAVVEGVIGTRKLVQWAQRRRLRNNAQSVDSTRQAPYTNDQPTVSRREFLWTTAVIAPPALTVVTGLAGYMQSQRFRVRQIDVDVPGLPAALNGMTIAHVSDVHAGKFGDEAHLARIANAVNDLRADIILATGDLIDFSLSDLPNALDAIRQMHAPGGVYMCEGNHDLFQSREEFEERVRAADVGLLINQTKTVRLRGHDVQLLGLRWGVPRDAADPRPLYLQHAEDAAKEVSRAVSGAGNSEPKNGEQWQPWRDDAGATVHLDAMKDEINPDALGIVLAHHPHAFDAAAHLGIPLTLAGHTHGGQLMLSKDVGVGPMMYRYWSGLYRKGDSRLVVSNGVGNWLPLRINAPAELIHITLRPA